MELVVGQKACLYLLCSEFCENLSYSPCHARVGHRPLGVVNRVRKVVYDTISGVRHEHNGEQRIEPTVSETF